ncbi:MAG TPA: outer membrane protein transport protein [Candidatus Hydrogenedentes bacterium]|nr:outer membrane protein transport protein [Candidatus Hydrogenedentota bacterium]HPG68539.1 outer membrane protein transport protein [Candidatus Hydrogenedentota bacterium]
MLVAPAGWGQIQINSSPNLVGSGARALGMGGAFIAVADDATAASWNPGGLTQLERPEISAVYSFKWLGEEFAHTTFIAPKTGYEVHLDDFNYLSVAYPFKRTIAGRNFVLSLNYQHKFDFDRAFQFQARSPLTALGGGLFYHTNYDIRYKQEGSLSALSPAFGFEITNKLSCGLVANLWDSDLISSNGWESYTEGRVWGHLNSGLGGIGRLSTYEEYENFQGTNYTVGLLYKPMERLSLGAVYHAGFKAHVDYTRRYTSLNYPFPVFNIVFPTYRSRLEIEFPQAYGLGAAYRFADEKLTLSLDVTRRDWDDFVQTDDQLGGRGRISPITGLRKDMSPHDPTYSVRLGAEYVFVDATKPVQNFLPSLRGGLFYDPEPASGRKQFLWWVKDGDGKVDDYYGVTLGAGVLIKNRVNIDAVYQYRWGSDVRSETIRTPNRIIESGFKTDVDQHAAYVSTVIYF